MDKKELTKFVLNKSNEIYTTSLIIAEQFGKEHKHVLRDIDELQCSKEFNRSNFGLISYKDNRNRTQKMYKIKRDGFMFLVMGYTGKKASEEGNKETGKYNKEERG